MTTDRKAGVEFSDRLILLFAKTSHLVHLFKVFWKETIPPTLGMSLFIPTPATPLPLLTLIVSILGLTVSLGVLFIVYRFAKGTGQILTSKNSTRTSTKRKAVRTSLSKPSRLRQQRKPTTRRKKRSVPPAGGVRS